MSTIPMKMKLIPLLLCISWIALLLPDFAHSTKQSLSLKCRDPSTEEGDCINNGGENVDLCSIKKCGKFEYPKEITNQTDLVYIAESAITIEHEEKATKIKFEARKHAIGYLIKYWDTAKKQQGQIKVIHPSKEREASIDNLEPKTTYEVIVLVKLWIQNRLICIADIFKHDLRGIVICPKQPPPPLTLVLDNATSTGFTVSWKETEQAKQCNTSYLLRVEPEGSSIPNETLKESPHQVSNVLSYTNYSVIIQSVYDAQQQGLRSAEKKSWIETLSKSPTKVLHAEASLLTNNSVKVSWSPPPESPRTGELEKYKINWCQDDTTSTIAYTNQTFYIIEEIEPNINYIITIVAKNKHVEQYGDKQTITQKFVPKETTTPTSISEQSETATPTGISEQSETVTSTSTSEQSETTTPTSISEQSETVTSTSTSKQSEAVTPTIDSTLRTPTVIVRNNSGSDADNSRKYFVVKWPHSSDDTEEEFKNPEVEETLQVQAASDNTSRIKLPQVKNPPAWQYVVVLNMNTTLNDEEIQRKSLQIVMRYITERRRVDQAGQKDPQNKEEELDGWVAEMINISAMGNPTKDFEIGKGNGDNKPLEADKDYNVVVVTEKKSGPYSTFTMTDPVNSREVAVASGLSGIMFGALIFLVLICLFAWTYMRKQNKNLVIRVPTQEQDILDL